MLNCFRLAGMPVYIAMVFLNAFVDLGHKIVIQNTLFKTLDGNEQIIMTGILNALILLPLAILFTPAGFISDRFAKPRVMQLSAWFAIVLTLLITSCYYLGKFELAFAMTFLLAVQSAIYSPAKYGYLRELAGKERLSEVNAMVQATTILAILMGTFVVSIIFEQLLPDQASYSTTMVLKSVAPVGWLLVCCSVIELFFAYNLPSRAAAVPDLRVDWKKYARGEYLRKNIGSVYNDNVIWICIVGLAVFWGISQVMVTVFPAHAKSTLGETNTVIIQGILACTGIGIVLGSSITARYSHNYIEAGFIPVGAIGIAILLFVMPSLDTTTSLGIAFLFVGIFSGFFIVPLNALIQFHARQSHMARILAANNLLQTLSMLGFLLLTVLTSIWAVSSHHILVSIGIVAICGAIYTAYRLPHSLIRFVLARTIGLGYRVNVLGLNHLPSQGGVLMLGNHISSIDWAIIGIASPRKIRFVMYEGYYNLWYLKWFLGLMGCIPISSGQSRSALSSITEMLNNGEVVCLFPEGRLTQNGQMSEFKQGFERAAENANAVILPFYITGLWGSRFSHV